MNTTELLRSAMQSREMSQTQLAKQCGLSGQSAVGNALARKHGVRVDTLISLLSAMGYEITVRDSMNKQIKWVLSCDTSTRE